MKYLILFILYTLVAAEIEQDSTERCGVAGTNEINGANLHSFEGCTNIEGNLLITTESFYDMHPNRLEIFNTVKTITGFFNIEGFHIDFKNLSYFRNLQFIHGQTPEGVFYTLNIDNTSLESLELLSLKQIRGRGAAIAYNKNLCYAHTIEWKSVVDAEGHVVVLGNRELTECKADGLTCDLQCSEEGCWGAGPDKCFSCKNYLQHSKCVQECDFNTESHHTDCHKACPSTMYENNGNCMPCHDQCTGCHGPTANKCTYCKHFKEEESCVQICPESKYSSYVASSNALTCLRCPPNCQFGCTVRNNAPICNKCTRHQPNRLLCMDNCPVDYFESTNSNNGTVSCTLCHAECATCTGPGPDNCISCKNTKMFKSSILNNSGRQSFRCMSGYEIIDEFPSCEQDSQDDLVYYCYSNKTRRDLVGILIGLMIILIFVLGGILYYYRKSQWFVSLRRKSLEQYEDEHQELGSSTILEIKDSMKENGNSENIIITKGTHYKETTFGELYFGFVTYKDLTKKSILIKVITKHLIKDRDDFKTNMEFISSMEHQYLVKTTFHVSKYDEVMFIRDLVPLGNVLDFIKENKADENKIDAIQVLDWCKQVAEGMLHLERNGIVHRDLAARNLILHDDYSIKIKDFGVLALLYPSYKKKASAWQAPECIDDLKFTHKSDVWAFGVTAYELLTFGKDPDEFILYIKDDDMNKHLEWGITFPIPRMCKYAMYQFLRTCWYDDTEKRPSFRELSIKCNKIRNNADHYIITSTKVPAAPRLIQSKLINLIDVNESKHMTLPMDRSGDDKPTSTWCLLGNANGLAQLKSNI